MKNACHFITFFLMKVPKANVEYIGRSTTAKLTAAGARSARAGTPAWLNVYCILSQNSRVIIKK
jgi:hypothetical protein